MYRLVARLVTFRFTIAIVIVTLVLSLAVGTGARPYRVSGKQKLSGTWQLNHDLSMSGRGETLEQLGNDGQSLPIPEPTVWRLAANEPRIVELLEATELLEILLHGRELTMNATGGSDVVLTRTLLMDGQPSEQSFVPGAGSSQARWANGRLVIETQTTIGPRVIEIYELVDVDRLRLSVRIENQNWARPLLLQRVYDRIS
jgi:hypothetical protein